MSWRKFLRADTQPPPLSFWDNLTLAFFPSKEDPDLLVEFTGLAESAFRVAGLVMVGAVAWVFLLEQVTRVPTAGRPWGHVAMVLTGVLAYAMSYSETARKHARPVAVALGVTFPPAWIQVFAREHGIPFLDGVSLRVRGSRIAGMVPTDRRLIKFGARG